MKRLDSFFKKSCAVGLRKLLSHADYHFQSRRKGSHLITMHNGSWAVYWDNLCFLFRAGAQREKYAI